MIYHFVSSLLYASHSSHKTSDGTYIQFPGAQSTEPHSLPLPDTACMGEADRTAQKGRGHKGGQYSWCAALFASGQGESETGREPGLSSGDRPTMAGNGRLPHLLHEDYPVPIHTGHPSPPCPPKGQERGCMHGT